MRRMSVMTKGSISLEKDGVWDVGSKIDYSIVNGWAFLHIIVIPGASPESSIAATLPFEVKSASGPMFNGGTGTSWKCVSGGVNPNLVLTMFGSPNETAFLTAMVPVEGA